MKQMSEEFTKWVDSLDRDFELTIDQLMLMNEAWCAVEELSKHYMKLASDHRDELEKEIDRLQFYKDRYDILGKYIDVDAMVEDYQKREKEGEDGTG